MLLKFSQQEIHNLLDGSEKLWISFCLSYRQQEPRGDEAVV